MGGKITKFFIGGPFLTSTFPGSAVKFVGRELIEVNLRLPDELAPENEANGIILQSHPVTRAPSSCTLGAAGLMQPKTNGTAAKCSEANE